MPVARFSALAVSAIVFSSLLIAPAAASAADTARPAVGVVNAAYDQSSARQVILNKTNAARVAAGLAPVSGDASLDAVAQSCSQTQAANNAMAHCTGFQNKYPGGWTSAAENVAMGQSVEAVVDAWLNSPGHRANILRPDATHLGIGYALSSSGRPFYTQNFATYPASVRAASGPRYYRTAYDGSIWRVEGTSVKALSYQDWKAAGFPAWQNAPTDYVRYPWSSSISAVTFFGQNPAQWVWKHLDYSSWSAAGRPNPRTAGWIEGSSIHQWSTGSELFLRDIGGVVHRLDYREWQATGFRGYERKANQGFVKLSWDASGTVAFLCDIAGGKGTRVDYRSWAGEGAPSPLSVSRTPGDVVWRGSGSQLHYWGPVADLVLSYRQWQAMGSPAPSDATVAAARSATCS